MMKKMNYLNYLGEDNEKILVNGEKTFNKQLKKLVKTKSTKQDKQKDCYNKIQNAPYLSIQKRTENKENLHPNFNFPAQNDQKPMKRSQSIYIHPSQNIEKQNIVKPHSLHNNIPKGFNTKELTQALTRCNFEPMHSSENLYLVETETHQELIVCEKCSELFHKKTKLAEIKSKNISHHSYASLVGRYESLQEENKKVKRIQLIEKENLHLNLDKVLTYYTQLIQRLIDAKDSLEREIIEVYEMNFTKLSHVVEENEQNIRKLDKRIEEMERNCIENNEMRQVENDYVDEILAQSGKGQVELCSIDLSIPINIVDDFEADFVSSKFCIRLQNNKEEEKPLSIAQTQEVIEQTVEIDEDVSPKITNQQSKSSLSQDFEKELPFNVDFEVTETKDINFSHKIDDVLSKISSSEELLIESLRYQECKPNKDLQNEKHQNLHNFKTEASTHRAEEIREENSCSKRNFIKHLHVENNEMDDMMCDEDLTLSYSHPIYENQPVQPRNSMKLQKKNPKTSTFALTLSQLDSQVVRENSQIANSSLINPSIITASENKHEISFELDENLIIDANILPEEYDDPSNLDIISPAFKII